MFRVAGAKTRTPAPRRARPPPPAGSATPPRPGGRTRPPLARPFQRADRGVTAAEPDRQLVAERAAGDEQASSRPAPSTRIGRCRPRTRSRKPDHGAADRVVLRPEDADQLAPQRRGDSRPPSRRGRRARRGPRTVSSPRRPSGLDSSTVPVGPGQPSGGSTAIVAPAGSLKFKPGPERPDARRRSDRGADRPSATSGRSTEHDPVEVRRAEDLDAPVSPASSRPSASRQDSPDPGGRCRSCGSIIL